MHPSMLLGALSIPLALASAVRKRDCNSITFGGKYGGDGYTKTYDSTFMVSQPMNCTAALARNDGGMDNNYCEYERYGEGLEVHSTLNVTVADPQQVFEMVKKTTGHMKVDMNETVVMNFTNPVVGYSVNFTGYWGFTPFLRCYEGLLTDCDSDDKAVNATAVTACGLQIIQLSDDPGRILYDGEVAGVQFGGDLSKYASMTEPQPRYEDVKGNATFYKNEGSVGTATTTGLWGGVMVAMLWSLWWSVA